MGLDVVTKASMATWVAVLTGVACGGGERRMQEPDALVLTGSAGAELAAFTSPRGFVALSDSLVLVSDSRERRLAVLDMNSRTQRDVGTRGRGPREFEFPGHAVRYLRGAALWDRGNGRILILDSLGEPIHTVVPPQGLLLTELGAGDEAGYVYLAGSEAGRLGEGSQPEPTVPLLRWHVASGRIDTLTSLRAPELAIGYYASGGTRTMLSFPNPYSPADAWRVTEDGRVIVVRAVPFHIEVFRGAALQHRGDSYPVESVPITDDERGRFDRMSAYGAEFVWPESKPAFPHDAMTLLNDSLVVVARSPRDGDDSTTVDVFDLEGRRHGSVTTSARVRVVASFGPLVVVTRRDDDDVMHVETATMSRQ